MLAHDGKRLPVVYLLCGVCASSRTALIVLVCSCACSSMPLKQCLALQDPDSLRSHLHDVGSKLAQVEEVRGVLQIPRPHGELVLLQLIGAVIPVVCQSPGGKSALFRRLQTALLAMAGEDLVARLTGNSSIEVRAASTVPPSCLAGALLQDPKHRLEDS